MRPALVPMRPAARSDRGAILPAASILMVLLLMVAAFAVDLGNLRQEQVEFQGAVDLAALAGAQDLPDIGAATDTVLDYAQFNLGVKRGEWVGCVDDEALPLVDRPAVTGSCISFSNESTIIRVRLPLRPVDNAFGGVVGVESFEVDVAAEAAAMVSKPRQLLPATVSSAVDPGLRCIESSGANTGCSSHVDGFFGSILNPRLTSFIPSGGIVTGEAQAINYAMNLDHEVVPFDPATAAVCDGAIWVPCSTSNLNGGTANHLVISTGNDVPPVTEGLVTGGVAVTSDLGSATFCGRLTRPDLTAGNALDPLPGDCLTPGEPTINHIGYTINGRHPYHWLTPEAKGWFYPEIPYDPNVVEPSLTSDAYHPGDARLACFLDGYRYDAATDTETVPDCSAVGLTTPAPTTSTPVLHTAWTSDTLAYNDLGTPAIATPWVEAGDDGIETTGVLTSRSSSLYLAPQASIFTFLTRRFAVPPDTVSVTFRTHWDPVDVAGFEDTWIAEYFDGFFWRTIYTRSQGIGIDSSNFAVPPGVGAIRIRFRRFSGDSGSDGLFIYGLEVDLYTASTGPAAGRTVDPIFDPAMVADVRFSTIPIITDWPASGTKASAVHGFWYAYLYDLYGTSTKIQAFDAWIFDPALIGADSSAEFVGYGFEPNALIRLRR